MATGKKPFWETSIGAVIIFSTVVCCAGGYSMCGGNDEEDGAEEEVMAAQASASDPEPPPEPQTERPPEPPLESVLRVLVIHQADGSAWDNSGMPDLEGQIRFENSRTNIKKHQDTDAFEVTIPADDVSAGEVTLSIEDADIGPNHDIETISAPYDGRAPIWLSRGSLIAWLGPVRSVGGDLEAFKSAARERLLDEKMAALRAAVEREDWSDSSLTERWFETDAERQKEAMSLREVAERKQSELALAAAIEACAGEAWDGCVTHATRVNHDPEAVERAQSLLRQGRHATWKDTVVKRGAWFGEEISSRIRNVEELERFRNPRQEFPYDLKELKPKEGYRWIILSGEDVNKSNEVQFATKHGGLGSYELVALDGTRFDMTSDGIERYYNVRSHHTPSRSSSPPPKISAISTAPSSKRRSRCTTTPRRSATRYCGGVSMEIRCATPPSCAGG